MRKIATTTTASFTNMLPPAEREMPLWSRADLRGPDPGNLERAAIDCGDIEDFAGLAGSLARDLRVPERIAVPHARMARAFVDPGFEGRRLAEVERLHALRVDGLPVPMHPDDSRDRDDRGDDRLREE